MRVKAITTRVFKENEDLTAFILRYVTSVKEGSILAVTSKIVSLAEGRVVTPKDSHAKERLIKEESDVAIQTKHTWLTLSDGMMSSSAGIDESNADGKLILLPKDSFKSAKRLHTALSKKYKVKKFGVVITDSRTLPMRAGAIGLALGYAGFKGIRDYRKTPDLFGRPFKVSRANIADGLAASAVLSMGEGRESRPIAMIEGAENLTFVDRVNRNEVKIDIKDDMFGPLFARYFKKPRNDRR
jgi:F420-0:gamma-glutamyl ligase